MRSAVQPRTVCRRWPRSWTRSSHIPKPRGDSRDCEREALAEGLDIFSIEPTRMCAPRGQSRLGGPPPREGCREGGIMPSSYTQLLVVNMLLAVLLSTTVMDAPVLPALAGAIGAGGLLYGG